MQNRLACLFDNVVYNIFLNCFLFKNILKNLIFFINISKSSKKNTKNY